MIEELSEGEAIVPRNKRQLEKDALKWKIIGISDDEDDPRVTFQAGTYTNSAGMVIPVIFKCYKSGMIYREWKKEAERRAAGGPIQEKQPYVAGDREGCIDIDAVPIERVFKRASESGKDGMRVESYMPAIVQLVDSQLEERQHRIRDLRKKAAMLDWCDHDKSICTGKCKIIDEIIDIEKKILGDP